MPARVPIARKEQWTFAPELPSVSPEELRKKSSAWRRQDAAQCSETLSPWAGPASALRVSSRKRQRCGLPETKSCLRLHHCGAATTLVDLTVGGACLGGLHLIVVVRGLLCAR